MKTAKMLTLAALLMSALSGRAQNNETNFTLNVNQAIPDGSPLGLVLSTNLTVLGGGISDVTVSLDITGGFNGDLYAYLAGPNGGFAVLLNRVGASNNASMFGYGDAGLNVTFSDAAANDIHYYQNVISYDITSGTALWQPDGRNIDPQSDPNSFSTAAHTAMLGSFENDNPNGTWTLFLADLSGGGQSTLVSLRLDIITAPEPSTMAMIGLGLGTGMLLIRRRS
jgi:subtilisin-like proprotein convertase family protein